MMIIRVQLDVTSASERHVELLRGILSGEGEDSELATGVLRQEAGDVKHLKPVVPTKTPQPNSV